MRTNVVVDDSLMEEALNLTGLATNREVVELALKTLVTLCRQEEIQHFKGKLQWDGDLESMRGAE